MEIKGKQIIALGYPEGKVIGTALGVIRQELKDLSDKEILNLLANILKNPINYLKNEGLAPIAKELLSPAGEEGSYQLEELHTGYKIYGAEGIEPGAIKQMELAMRLPVARAGALMPDAHQGYGLPIGGVLATENAVIPYGVGVDIGCRMCMTIYDVPPVWLEARKEDLTMMLMKNTMFGKATFKKPKDHAILEDPLFNEIKVIRDLKDRAAKQIGSSGGGNHFVEFGIAELTGRQDDLSLSPGEYLAVLSHSGSRGLGANIANHYTKVAMEKCRLPQEARHLAWLDLDSDEGQEYWAAMNLAGEYASACHHQIHERMAADLMAKPLRMIENHHNFAWKEKNREGHEVIVHRKGATPAGKGILGIIPGSMTAPGYIVKGKGEALSVDSAAHGAGRVMSRTRAKKILDRDAVVAHIDKAGVTVIGSDLDEAPMAYKDIRQVMASQKNLVEVLGTFTPKIVRMCGDRRFHEVD